LDDVIANPAKPHESTLIGQRIWKGETIHEFAERSHKDGHLVEVEILGEQIKINGKPIGIVELYRDITIETRAQEAQRASEERFRRMFLDSPVALRMEDYSSLKKWIDINFHDKNVPLKSFADKNPELLSKLSSLPILVDLNEATLSLFGTKDKEELQKKLHEILSEESRGAALEIIESLMAGKTSLERELAYKRLDGKKIYTITRLSIVPGYENSWGRILFSNLDITERKLAEERLEYISMHDTMTGIYNRAYFEEEISRLSKSRIHPISILVMDMDGLKAINDQFGHKAGDRALQNIADIVKRCFRNEDIIARIGGDEFAILLPGTNHVGAEKARDRIQQCVLKHNQRKRTKFSLSVSIGCATATKGSPLTDIFQMADTQMYQEKKDKKDNGKLQQP
jgi:diguanylate cyclase (GGDEF)-like protein/PAS domain S-box-containing protein